MKKKLLVLSIILCIIIPLQAKTYSNLKNALKAILPAGETIYKVKVKLNKSQAGVMNDFGQGDFLAGDVFELYYTKTPENQVDIVAVPMLEVLLRYQSIHRWVIGMKPDGTRVGLSVMELTDHYAYPLAEQRFLERFASRKEDSDSRGIAALDSVSGATESSMILRYSVKRVQYLIELAGLK